MPVSVNKRRRSRREPSAEDIEEDTYTQNRIRQEDSVIINQTDDHEHVNGRNGRGDTDDEDEQQPRRPGQARNGRNRGAGTSASVAHNGNGTAAPEDDDPLKDFKDAPLDRASAEKLKGLASDWSMTRNHIHMPAFAAINDIAMSIAEFEDGEKGKQATAEMDVLMRQLIDTEHELHAQESVLQNLHQSVVRGEEITDVFERYKKGVQQERDKYAKKTLRGKYGQDDHYLKFRQAIWEVQNPDEAMPPVSEFLPREQGDESDDDDDVQVGGVTQDYKCPLTLTILVEPLTSTVCGHSFSAAAIREYLGPNKSTMKRCPASGCNQTFCQNDLKVDKELGKKAKDAARRERMREEDSDGEEVIE